MHFLSSLTLLFFTASISFAALASPHAEPYHSPPSFARLLSNRQARAAALHHRSAFAIPDIPHQLVNSRPFRIPRRDALPNASPQLAFIGSALRGLSRLPESAGRKMGKNQGENATKQQDDQKNQKIAEDMAANFKKQGYKDVDVKCLKNMVDHLSVTGGGGDYSTCWTKPSQQQQDRDRMMDEARKGMGRLNAQRYSSSSLSRWGRG